VFKPVTPKHRLSSTPSRQASTPAPDSRSSVTPTVSRDVTTPAPTQPSMPPPSVIPTRSVSSALPLVEPSSSSRETPVTPKPPPKVIPSFTSSYHAQRTPGSHSVLLPPNPVAPQPPTVRPVPSPGPSPPSIMVGKCISTPIRVAQPSIPEASNLPVASSTPSESSQVADFLTVSQAPLSVPSSVATVSYDAFHFPMTENISQVSDTETPLTSRRAPNSGNGVKPPPRRNPGRKKRGTPKSANLALTSVNAAEISNESAVSATPVTTKRPRQSTATESDPSDGVTEPKKRQRKAPSGPRKPRRPRIPSVPSYDPNADPGEEIDPTAVTMATLCKDMGQGRVSSKAVQIQNNHAAWKASNRDKRAKMKALMESKKYGTTEDDISPKAANVEAKMAEVPAESSSSRTPTTAIEAVDPSLAPEPTAPDESGHGFDYSQAVSTSRYNVQVRIGPNGETVIDEESLFIDRNEDEGTENYSHVEESDTTKFVNSGTYGKKFRGSRWSAEETELFFDV
jgi:transcription factor TFIIIB component B''